MIICIDVGGVLTQYEHKEAFDNPIINVNGALEVLEKWKINGYKVYIISYCKEKSAIFRTTKLETDGHNKFFDFEYYIANKMNKKDVISYIGNVDVMIDDNEEILNKVKE